LPKKKAATRDENPCAAAIPESSKPRANSQKPVVSFSQLLEEFAGRARNKYSAGHAALAILHPFHDAGCLATLWTIRALGCVHDFLTICCLCNLGHRSSPGKILPQAAGPDENTKVRESRLGRGIDIRRYQILHEELLRVTSCPLWFMVLALDRYFDTAANRSECISD